MIVLVLIALAILLIFIWNYSKSHPAKNANSGAIYFSPTISFNKYSTPDYSFKYPEVLKDFKMIKHSDDTNLDTHSYYWATYEYDSDLMPFVIALYPTGYAIENELFHIHADENKFNLDATLKEIDALDGNSSRVIGYKKLGDSTGLLIEYSNIECSPDTSVEVIAPVKNSTKFSNFRVRVNLPELNNITPNPEDQCDLYDGFKIIADGIMAGAASQSVKDQIALAQMIAESFATNK